MRRAVTTRFGVAMAVVALGLAGCGGSGGDRDSTVAHDLQGLLDSKVMPGEYHVDLCFHQSGNQFTCKVTKTSIGSGNKSRAYVSVTDDGTNIFEQGIAGP